MKSFWRCAAHLAWNGGEKETAAAAKRKKKKKKGKDNYVMGVAWSKAETKATTLMELAK